MFASFTSSNLAHTKTRPLTSDIVVCDCSHEICLGFVPYFPDFDLNLLVQSPNQWCSCDKNQHWVSQQSVVSIILYFTM
jgi:hypothetical protein